MNLNEIKDLRLRRGKIADDMQAILTGADKRALTVDERTKFDAMDKEQDELRTRIEAEEKSYFLGEELRKSGLDKAPITMETAAKPKDEGRAKAMSDAFLTFLRRGPEGATEEERKLLMEMRDFSSGTSNTGGYTVPNEFLNRLEVALKFYGAMWNTSEVIKTASGGSMALPSMNDTAVTGELLAENSAATSDTSTPFGTLSLPAYMYSSRLVAVSLQLMQDSAFDVEKVVIDMLAARLGRITNAHFTTGDGSSKPRGIVIDATLGKTGTTGQTTSVIYDDLVDLVYAVDPAYRQMGNCAFMLNDASVKVIRKLKDGQNRPLWEPSVQVGQPDMLLGFPVKINNDIATMAASAKSILFGDFSKYKIRQVLDTQVARLNERLMDKLQVGFIGFLRAGGSLLDAGTHPVVYYANSAS